MHATIKIQTFKRIEEMITEREFGVQILTVTFGMILGLISSGYIQKCGYLYFSIFGTASFFFLAYILITDSARKDIRALVSAMKLYQDEKEIAEFVFPGRCYDLVNNTVLSKTIEVSDVHKILIGAMYFNVAVSRKPSLIYNYHEVVTISPPMKTSLFFDMMFDGIFQKLGILLEYDKKRTYD